MADLPQALIGLGLLFLLGLAADALGHRSRLPRVTLLLLCGLAAGDAGFGLIPESVTALYPPVTIIALSMVAFLLGSALSAETLRAHGRAILVVSLTVTLCTLGLVALGLWALGTDPVTALVLGAIATATAPAATYDVIRQSGVDNGFTRVLKGIVAIDDAWGLMLFSVVLVLARIWTGTGDGGAVLGLAAREIGGAVGLGLVIGLPAAVLTGRLSDGEPLRIEALGLVFLTAGLALALDLPYLIAGMTAGMVIVNLARHHKSAFHEIENLQWPFMIVFFVLAGTTLDAAALKTVGLLGAAYMLLRILARIAGGWLGAVLAGAPRHWRPWIGPALLPQAGVAVGMALIASEQIPGQGARIMALTIAATVVFELIGPVAAGIAIRRTRDVNGQR